MRLVLVVKIQQKLSLIEFFDGLKGNLVTYGLFSMSVWCLRVHA